MTVANVYDGHMPKQPAVDRWFLDYDNPMKDVVMAIRQVILGADARIDECIKWQAPTFMYQGNLASFFPKSKKHASLMFHQGALIPGKHPRLEGDGDTSRVLKLGTVAEVRDASDEIEKIVQAWIAWKGEPAEKKREGTKAAGKKTAVKKTTAKTTAAKKTAAKKKTAVKKPSKTTPAVGKAAATNTAGKEKAKKKPLRKRH